MCIHTHVAIYTYIRKIRMYTLPFSLLLIHTHIHTHMYLYMYTYAYTCTYFSLLLDPMCVTYMYTSRICMYIYIYMHTYAYTYMYLYAILAPKIVGTCMYMHMYACICICTIWAPPKSCIMCYTHHACTYITYIYMYIYI
jgi:hypothetical protein